MKNETFTNTTASAILIMMASDRATANLDAMEIGESISATGVRNLIGGGARTSEYTVTRVANDRDSRRYTCHRMTSEA